MSKDPNPSPSAHTPSHSDHPSKATDISSKVASSQLKEVKLSELPKLRLPSMPTVWVDMVEILHRNDVEVASMVFYTHLDDNVVEAARVQMPVSLLRNIGKMINRAEEIIQSNKANPT